MFGAAAAWSACSKDPAPTPPAPVRSSSAVVIPSNVQPLASVAVSEDAGALSLTDAHAPEDAADAPYEGPFIGALVQTAPIYSEPSRTREAMIGYMRLGARAPVDAKPLAKSNCKEGWYRLLPRGYICGRHGTLDMNDSRVKLGVTVPDIDAVVPYKYAYNNKNGTPLYRTVPTREEMERYEPYLVKPRTSKPAKTVVGDRDAGSSADETPVAADNAMSDAGVAAAEPDAAVQPEGGTLQAALLAAMQDSDDAGAAVVDAAPDVPWWQRDPDAGPQELRLADLEAHSDNVLAKRMVKGFFVAVDKTFRWNNRFWHKTTAGLVAPADRMSINAPPEFQGVRLTEADSPQLPIAFVLPPTASTYEMRGDNDVRKAKRTVKRYAMVALTGKTATRGGTEYHETRDGVWLRGSQIARVQLASQPADLRAGEKWIDVNLTQQTLVAYEGDRPVYATLMSSGKKGRTRSTDHSTVQGAFRIREKHITATMDGDGASPGEMPYSIEDVPYVMYFKNSYALHGAFWHNNFGRRMSHGCVNLSPLDAKFVFMWSEPALPQGWHGIWATNDHPGTLVVVHD